MKGEEIDHRVVVDATPALIFSARPDGYVDYFNRRWFVLVGARQDELEGWGWTKFIHPDDLEQHVQRWRTAMIEGQPPVSPVMSTVESVVATFPTRAMTCRSGAEVPTISSNIDV